MTFHAQIVSPLGPLLLCSEGSGLGGLYFIGQSDCPAVAGLGVRRSQSGGPSAGTMDGVAIKNLKAYRNPTGDLFDTATVEESRFWPDTSLRGLAHDVQLMQSNTPAGVVALFEQARDELNEYYAGKRKVFDVPLNVSGTEFQKKVWQALLTIPYGQIAAYGDIARRAGLTPQHGRPVGTAVGRNPITIIIPCHRVLSGTGAMTGYTGGLERKFALLELEGFTLR